MTPRGFRLRSTVQTGASLFALGLLGILMFSGCGTAGTTYSPAVNGQGVAKSADFSIAVAPSSVSVVAGATAHYTVTLTSINGFSSNVALSASGLPTGAVATFGALTLTSTGATATLDIATANAGVGQEARGLSGAKVISASNTHARRDTGTTFTVTGVGGGITHSTTATLVVTAAPDFTIAVTPATVSVPQGTTASYTVTLTSIGGFDVSTVALSPPTGVPINTSSSYGTRTVTATGATIPLNIRTSIDDQTLAGNSTITVSGTGSSITHTATAALDVTDFAITVTPASVTVSQGPTAQYTVTVTSLNGFSSPVTLSVLGLPNGSTGTFTNSTVTPTASGVSTTLTITTSGINLESTQTYFLDASGTYLTAVHSAPMKLIVLFE